MKRQRFSKENTFKFEQNQFQLIKKLKAMLTSRDPQNSAVLLLVLIWENFAYFIFVEQQSSKVFNLKNQQCKKFVRLKIKQYDSKHQSLCRRFQFKIGKAFDTLKFEQIQIINIVNITIKMIQMDVGSQKAQQNFFFELINNKFMDSKQTKQILTKWGLFDSLRIGSFRFNQSFKDIYMDSFLRDLFSSPNIRFIHNNIKLPNDTVSEVKYNKINCDQITTEMFQKLRENGVVSGDYIQKTFGDNFEGIQISDQLRECLLLKESDKYQTFDAHQRNQLLFRIFQTLVVGGSLNQYEDNFTPYLDWTRRMYKSVVSVRKQPESGNIYIDSSVVQIKSIEKNGFIQDHCPQNFAYVIICPSVRTVNIISNQWSKFW